MAERLIAIIDNGPGKRGGTCDDCGIALRYEYHTSGGGRFGCECIHRHIHPPHWLSFKAKRDAELFAKIQRGCERQYQKAVSLMRPLKYVEFSDGSGYLDVSRCGEHGTQETIERLLAQGWTKEIFRSAQGWTLNTNRSRTYLITPPREKDNG